VLTRTIRAGALAVLMIGLTACSFSRYDIPSQVGSYNGSLVQLEEEAILVNILRASESEPLGFTQVTQVLGSGGSSFSIGLPTIGIGGGPQQPTQNRAIFGPNGVALGPRTNFNLSPLETKEFWLGMLTPLSADTLAFFINQGVSREVLFYLYLQRVQISAAGKTPEIDVNDPAAPRFNEFSEGLRVALTLGLTAQTKTQTLDVGPPLPANQATDVNNLLSISKAGLDIVPSKGGGTYQLQATRSTAVLCFDQARASVDIAARLGPSVGCGSNPLAGSAPSSNPLTFQFYPRSTYDIFRYLGSVVRESLRQGGHNVDLVTEESKSFSGSDPTADKLFVVEKNSHHPAFVSVKYGRDTYSIPKSATTSIQVVALLRELVALSTSVNSLPPTGALTTVIP
jgi:hypothetical protein